MQSRLSPRRPRRQSLTWAGQTPEADSRAAVLARWSSGLELPPDIADIVSDLRALP
jgi:hypothetical protein